MATLTITTPTDQDARIAAAFGLYLGIAGGQPASGAQIKQAVVNWMVDIVRRAEYQSAVNAVAQPTPITPG